MALGWLWWRAWARLVAGDAAQLCVAGVALGDIHLRFAWQAWRLVTPPNFAWQAWHLETSTFVSHGWSGMQTWHFLTSTFVLRGRRGTYGTGLALVALGHAWSPATPPNFAWQAWHLEGSTFVSRRMRGRHPPSFCVAGVALMALGWLWWRAWARLVAGVAAQLCVAGVALGDIHLRFAWQAWHLVTSAFVLRGRCGTS